MKQHSLLGPVLAMIVPYIFFETLRSGIFFDPELFKPKGHFYIVTIVAILATFIAIAIGIAGRRLRNIKVNIKVTFLALSFISLAQMFSVHGLSTPHFILDVTHLPAVSAQLSMVLATIWLMFSSLPTDSKIVGFFTKHNKFLLPIWIGLLALLGVVSMKFQHMVDIIPLTVKPLNWILMLSTMLLNTITMYGLMIKR